MRGLPATHSLGSVANWLRGDHPPLPPPSQGGERDRPLAHIVQSHADYPTSQRGDKDRRRAAAAAAVAWVMFAIVTLGSTAASGQDQPAPGDNAPLARYFPRKDLVLYLEWDGLDAHREAWRKTALCRLLNETTTGALYEQSLDRILDLVRTKQLKINVNGRDLHKLLFHMLRSGFAVGINRPGGPGSTRSVALVIRGAGAGEIRDIAARLPRSGRGPHALTQHVTKNGRKIDMLESSSVGMTAWWSEGNDLVVSLVVPSGPDAILAAIDGHEPNAVEHPERLGLARGGDAQFEPVGLAFFEMAALPPLPGATAGLGLEQIKKLTYRWGLRGEAIESELSAIVPPPRTGIPASFEQRVLDPANLPSLPGGLAGFTVFSLDLERIVRQAMDSDSVGDKEKVRFQANARPPTVETVFQHLTGLALREDLLAHLGTTFTIYNVPSRINAPIHFFEGLVQGLVRMPRLALVVDVKNHDQLAKAIDKIVERVNQESRGQPAVPTRGAISQFVRLKNEKNGYVCSVQLPGNVQASGMKPTLILGQKSLVVATSPALARRARDLSETSKSRGVPEGDRLRPGIDSLPAGLTMISVDDTAQSILPELIAALPGMVEANLRGEALFAFPFLARLASDEDEGNASPFDPAPVQSPFDLGPRRSAVAAGGGRFRGLSPPVDAELVPDPDTLLPFLFPSLHTLAVDAEGIHFLSREAVPTLSPAMAVPIGLGFFLPVARENPLLRRPAAATDDAPQGTLK
jgi:hypothetical protein